jgi:glycosyltransferase involved in cell wall biosynthesis
MRILNLLPRLPAPPVDGGAIGVYYPMKHLSKMGHELVTIAMVSNRHPQDPELYRRYTELYTIDGNFPEPDSWTAFRNLFSRKPYNLALRFAKPEFHKLIRKVAAEVPKPDVIQIDWIYMAEYLKTLRKAYPGVPVVLRQHNAEYVIFRRLAENESNPLKRIFLKYQAWKTKHYERRMMRKVDYYTTVTATDEALFRKLAPDTPGRTIPAGVDSARFERPTSMPREKSFIILGSLSWAPYAQSVQWFLENVWSAYAKANPGVILYVVGSAPPPEVQRWNGTNGVLVTGFVDDVMPLMHRCSAMIVPLLSGSGMRIKIVEAMAASLPVITTSVGVEGIEAVDGKHVLVGDRPDELRAHMDHILADPASANEMAQKAHQLAVDHYEWASIAKGFVEVYDSLTSEGYRASPATKS